MPPMPTEYIVADLSSERQRFLGISAGSGGGWVVKANVADAKTFIDAELAQVALSEWTGPIRRPFEWGHWKVYEIAGPETFLEVE